MFNEDQQQAKQLLLAELEKLENKNGSTKGQHNKSKLMGLKFMQNAEATQKKANKAEVEGLWRALEGHDRSDKTDEGGEEINDSGGTIIRAGRKKEGVVGKPEPNKSEFEEAKHSSEDGGGGDQAEVRIVNKPSRLLVYSRTPSHNLGYRLYSFLNQKARAGEKGCISSGPFPRIREGKESLEPNIWCAQDSISGLVRPKAPVLVAGRQESKNVKINSRPSKSKTGTQSP